MGSNDQPSSDFETRIKYEPVFLNIDGAPESIPRNSASLCSLAGQYDNPIPPRFLAPTDRSKIPALVLMNAYSDSYPGVPLSVRKKHPDEKPSSLFIPISSR
jgi:hypothetical protein